MLGRFGVLAWVTLGMPAWGQAQQVVACPLGPLFAFQVDAPARYAGLRDTTLNNAPVLAQGSTRSIVQFIVDTSGAPEARSFKVLSSRDSVAVARARSALPNWRFTRPRQDRCPVWQVVQLHVQ